MRIFLLFLSITAIVLLMLSVAVNQGLQQAAAIQGPATSTVTIDLVPKISTIIVDGRLYLSNELPLTFVWTRGTTHQILIEEGEINESADKRYVFERWTDLSEEQDRSFIVEDNINLRAIFKEQYNLRLISDHGDVYGSGWYDKGQMAVFGIKPTTVSDDELEGHRYAFALWDLGDSRKSPTNSILIQGPTVVKAIWYEQYYLAVTSSLGGTVVGGSGWHDKGQKVTLISDKQVQSEIPDMRYVFDSWASVGDYPAVVNAPADEQGFSTLIIDNPYNVEAKWKKAYYLDVQTPYGISVGSGYYKEGSQATISVSLTEFVTQKNKERVVFDGWTGKGVSANIQSGTGQVRVTGPAIVVAEWKPQYYLAISAEGGTASESGWYDVGSVVTISAEEQSGQSSFWMKSAFDRWSGDLSANTAKASIKMDSPKVVKAQWKNDYSPGFINVGILQAVAIVGLIAFIKFRRKKARFQRPELVGGMLPSDFSEPPWKFWRAKLVQRDTNDAEPT